VRRVLSTIRTSKIPNRAIVVVAPRQNLVRQLGATMAEFNPGDVGLYFAKQKEYLYPIVVCCSASLDALRADLESIGRKVSLLIADECHGTESETFMEVLPKLDPVQRVGFTATPMRSNPKESLSLWDRVLYTYSMEHALRDGVLVPIRVVRLKGTADRPVDEACLEMMMDHAEGPGIVSAKSIVDAEGYAEWLTSHGFSALAIHSKQSETEQARRIELLKTGQIRTLVHVSLLAEGVDMPWLRWICLRRNVKASVRFLQEIGRPMRSAPGKTECVVMDPHLLLGRFGLSPAEAIGKALEEAAEAEAREPVVRTFEPNEEQAVALERLIVHLYEVRDAMVAGGVMSLKHIPDNGWTLAHITQNQVAAIEKLKRNSRHIPVEHRDSIKTLAGIPWALNRGEASTLLDVLQGSRRYAREAAEALPDYVPDTVKWNLTWSTDVVGHVTVPERDAFGAIRSLERAKRKHDKIHGGTNDAQ